MADRDAVEPTRHLWVSVGDVCAPPERLPVGECEVCAALVPVDQLRRHRAAAHPGGDVR